MARFVEHTPVGTLGAANEDNHVVAGGKLQHSRQTVGHLATNGVVVVKTSRGLHVGRDILNNGAEAFQRFRSLREQTDVSAEIELGGFVHILNHNGLALGLSHQSQYLGMASLAIDDDLWMRLLVVGMLDAALQLQHHGACGIDDFNASLLGRLIGLGRLAVGTQQHFGVAQVGERGMVDGVEPQGTQTLALAAVVYDVAQTVQCALVGQLVFGFADGCGYAEAKPGVLVYFNGEHGRNRSSGCL